MTAIHKIFTSHDLVNKLIIAKICFNSHKNSRQI